MKILNGIRATGSQVLRTTDERGETIKITLKYFPTVQQWFVDLEHGDFVLNNQRVYLSPNITWAYARLLRFGIAVFSQSGNSAEPFLVTDFSSGRVQMLILTEAEIQSVDDFYVEERRA